MIGVPVATFFKVCKNRPVKTHTDTSVSRIAQHLDVLRLLVVNSIDDLYQLIFLWMRSFYLNLQVEIAISKRMEYLTSVNAIPQQDPRPEAGLLRPTILALLFPQTAKYLTIGFKLESSSGWPDKTVLILVNPKKMRIRSTPV